MPKARRIRVSLSLRKYGTNGKKKRRFDKGHLNITKVSLEEDWGTEYRVHHQTSDILLDTPPS